MRVEIEPSLGSLYTGQDSRACEEEEATAAKAGQAREVSGHVPEAPGQVASWQVPEASTQVLEASTQVLEASCRR